MPKFTELIPRLPVSNLNETLEFYCHHFGFSIEVLWPDDQPSFAIIQCDQTHIGFTEVSDAESNSIGYAELYIQVTDSNSLYETLKNNLNIEWGPEIYSYGHREFAVRDPNDYLIIFTEPVDESPTIEEP
jgi:catechol 2,3-dioxygenase-like lactoylglutathione lyase family enzyme